MFAARLAFTSVRQPGAQDAGSRMTAHWTRKVTYEADSDDEVVLRAGLVVGRVMWD